MDIEIEPNPCEPEAGTWQKLTNDCRPPIDVWIVYELKQDVSERCLRLGRYQKDKRTDEFRFYSSIFDHGWKADDVVRFLVLPT